MIYPIGLLKASALGNQDRQLFGNRCSLIQQNCIAISVYRYRNTGVASLDSEGSRANAKRKIVVRVFNAYGQVTFAHLKIAGNKDTLHSLPTGCTDSNGSAKEGDRACLHTKVDCVDRQRSLLHGQLAKERNTR